MTPGEFGRFHKPHTVTERCGHSDHHGRLACAGDRQVQLCQVCDEVWPCEVGTVVAELESCQAALADRDESLTRLFHLSAAHPSDVSSLAVQVRSLASAHRRALRHSVLADVAIARARQHPGNHANYPDGTGGPQLRDAAEQARRWCEQAEAEGWNSWRLVWETHTRAVFAETDPDSLRAALIEQIVAGLTWVEALDGRQQTALPLPLDA